MKEHMLKCIFIILLSLMSSMSYAKENEIFGNVIAVNQDNKEVFYYSLLTSDFIFNNGLVTQSIVGTFTHNPTDKFGKIDILSFRANPQFIDLLHKFLAEKSTKEPSFIREAKRQHDGWVYIIDKRVSDLNGDIAPQDLIGAFEIKEGIPTQYSGNPHHKILTADGVFQLQPHLQIQLVELIKSYYK